MLTYCLAVPTTQRTRVFFTDEPTAVDPVAEYLARIWLSLAPEVPPTADMAHVTGIDRTDILTAIGIVQRHGPKQPPARSIGWDDAVVVAKAVASGPYPHRYPSADSVARAIGADPSQIAAAYRQHAAHAEDTAAERRSRLNEERRARLKAHEATAPAEPGPSPAPHSRSA